MAIRNIIFDLGGVLLDISFPRTRDAFIAAGIPDFDSYYQQSYSNPLFAGLETGTITPSEFYEKFRQETGINLSDEAIRTSWNLLLGDFRNPAMEYLRSLKPVYKLFLFSNTNLIHYEAFIKSFEEKFGDIDFNQYFDKAYYSHEVNIRKPHAEAFLHILRENDLVAEETLFVDDTYVNIEGAEKAGLRTLWLQPGMFIETTLPEILAEK